MTLLEEYKRQSVWRTWEKYLDKLPMQSDQTIYDLGCSIGAVSRLFAQRVHKVVGFDNDDSLLEEARKHALGNCEFISGNIFTLNPLRFEKCDGIWTSFTLAYAKEPSLFISSWMKCLNYGGWFAIVDIDGLFSSHLSHGTKYFDDIDLFEKQSSQNKAYDFIMGSKIENLMERSGLELIVEEDDWYDKELNFKGRATPDVVQNWAARLERMISLKSYMGEAYQDFCHHFLETISQQNHNSNGGVKYYIGIKTK